MQDYKDENTWLMLGDCADEEYESVDCDYCEGAGCVECDPGVCICAATSSTECMCGAWYDEDY